MRPIDNYSIEEIRAAWVRAAEAELEKGITDEDGSEEIEEYFHRIGWSFWISKQGYKNVEKYAWCGVFIAATGLALGDFLEEDRCVDLALDSQIALFVLPSTLRLSDPEKWNRAGFPSPVIRGLAFPKMQVVPGCVAAVGSGPKGSHLILVRTVDYEEMTFTTIEGNATKKDFEGVISKTRDISEIKVLWEPDYIHFESLLS